MLLPMMHFEVAFKGDIYSEKSLQRKIFREASHHQVKKFALLAIINGTSWAVLVVVSWFEDLTHD